MYIYIYIYIYIILPLSTQLSRGQRLMRPYGGLFSSSFEASSLLKASSPALLESKPFLSPSSALLKSSSPALLEPKPFVASIFDDFGSIFGSIFEVFRGCIARATRLAARRAEPLFLLAGAVLSRVRRLYRKTKNRRKSTKNRSDDASRTRRARKTRFFRSRTRLGVDFGRPSALPSAPGRPF